MKTASRFLIVILGGLTALQLWATDREIDVVVTPSVLVKNNNSSALLTLHANVPFDEVAPWSARLLAIGAARTRVTLEPQNVFADDCGDLVVKFDAQAIKNLADPRPNRIQVIALVFTVTRLDGGVFYGTDTVRVKTTTAAFVTAPTP